MARLLPPTQCWVDIFESDYFMGRMHRLFGPKDLPQLRAKSVIVGPGSTLELAVRRDGKDRMVTIKAKKVVPDLVKSIEGGSVLAAKVRCAK
jgi:hypothetical protein